MVYDWTGEEARLQNRRLLVMRSGVALALICVSLAAITVTLI